MAISFKILGWKAKGLRCPDHDISFVTNGNNVHRISLLQMPNGTGKTTTLNLLRAALAGEKIWTEEFDKPRQFRKDVNTTSGTFELRLLYENRKRLTIQLTFDFTSEQGMVTYATTGPYGIDEGFNPPPALVPVLKPDFVNLLMFDGELAVNLLDPNHTNAQKAIEEMYQLSFLHRMQNRVDDYWNGIASTAGSKGGPKEFTQRKNRVAWLKQRIEEVTQNRDRDYAQLEEYKKSILQLEHTFSQEIKKNTENNAALDAATLKLTHAMQRVSEFTKDITALMKNPAELSGNFAQNIVALKDSLDRVKLPGIAAREFFEEIADEPDCICGRGIDEHVKEHIRKGAKKYLGSEEVAVINAMKSDIKDRIVAENISKHGDQLKKLIQELEKAQHAEFIARQKLDGIKEQAGNDDPQIKEIHDRITKLTSQQTRLEKEIEKYDDRGNESDNSWNLTILYRKFDEAEKDLADATGTKEQKAKRDILSRILGKAFTKATKNLSEEVCAAANQKIKKLMPHNQISIASIDKCLRLDQKDGGSAGETLAVSYAFLSSLLSNTTHHLPSVVDSPSGPVDLAIRPEIAQLIPQLGDQFIAFTISSERAGFVRPLFKAAKDDIFFLTLFRKTTSNQALVATAKAVAGHVESDDGIWVSGKDYFERFHADNQE